MPDNVRPALRVGAICACKSKVEVLVAASPWTGRLEPELIPLTRFVVRLSAVSLGWAVGEDACVCDGCRRLGNNTGGAIVWPPVN